MKSEIIYDETQVSELTFYRSQQMLLTTYLHHTWQRDSVIILWLYFSGTLLRRYTSLMIHIFSSTAKPRHSYSYQYET